MIAIPNSSVGSSCRLIDSDVLEGRNQGISVVPSGRMHNEPGHEREPSGERLEVEKDGLADLEAHLHLDRVLRRPDQAAVQVAAAPQQAPVVLAVGEMRIERFGSEQDAFFGSRWRGEGPMWWRSFRLALRRRFVHYVVQIELVEHSALSRSLRSSNEYHLELFLI